VSQTRVTLNGLRHYNCAQVPVPLASVTSILSATQTEETRKKLAHWNLLNPGSADKAAERGNWIHGAVENYIRGLDVRPPKDYEPYWTDVPEALDELLCGGKVLWSEKPYNQPQWSKYVGEDGVGRIHFYDEKTKQGWAGCCDIIYKDVNGEIILGDFKTSNGPYSARFPKAGAPIEDNVRKALVSGVFKLKKTQLQLAAYKLAAERCLDIKINKTQIIVSTAVPNFSVQVFTFGPKEIEKNEAQWLQIVQTFYDQLKVV
jgi:hypothetical protein